MWISLIDMLRLFSIRGCVFFFALGAVCVIVMSHRAQDKRVVSCCFVSLSVVGTPRARSHVSWIGRGEERKGGGLTRKPFLRM